jgi:NADH:ubiquinone reductase (non-electrogenic)
VRNSSSTPLPPSLPDQSTALPSHLPTWSMASTMRAMTRLPAASIGLRIATRRQFATSPQSFVTRARPSSRVHGDKSKLYQTFRRTYADVAPAKKPRRFRFFTYIWRLTYLSAIGGTAYLAYGVYDLRHPDEQFEPDPTKKNLVILGMYPDLPLCTLI